MKSFDVYLTLVSLFCVQYDQTETENIDKEISLLCQKSLRNILNLYHSLIAAHFMFLLMIA